MGIKKKIIILSLIFGMIAALLVVIVIFPLVRDIRNNLAEFISVKKELALSSVGTETSEQFRNKYRRIKFNLDKIDELFIDPQAPVNLIEFWEKTAADCGLSITISSISLKPKKNDLWNSIGFQINLTGSFPNVAKFLEKTESSFYLVESQTLILNKLGKSEEEQKSAKLPPGAVKANLLVKVFTR